MMDFLYDLCGKPFGWIMRLIYDWVDNYAFAILLFTIFTKLILFPISYKQQKNSARMQRVNPKMEKLRQKYKDDPKKMQEEQMKLYQEENVNPGASCLPMFLQFFILFGILDVVYKPLSYILKMKDSVISSAFEVVQKINPELAKQGTSLRRELTILTAHHSDASAFQSVLGDNLSAKISEFYDKFSLFGINLGEIPTWHPDTWNAAAIGLFMIPVLSGALQLALTIYMQISQKKRNPGAPNMGCNALRNAHLLRLVCFPGTCRRWLLLGMLVLLLSDPEHRSELLLHTGTHRKDLRAGDQEKRQEVCQRQKELYAAHDGCAAGHGCPEPA